MCLHADLNLLDWSAGNLLAVGLGAHIYLWNAGTGVINQLFELEGAEDYISSVSFVKDGNFIAVGTSNAEVQVILCKTFNNYYVSVCLFRVLY